MSTDRQEAVDEQDHPTVDDSDIETEHRRAQESGEVFEGGPHSDR